MPETRSTKVNKKNNENSNEESEERLLKKIPYGCTFQYLEEC